MFTKFRTTSLHLLAISALLVGFLVPAFSLQTASAAPIDVLQQCRASDSQVCKGSANSSNPLYSLIKNIINLLLTVVGIISVIMIIVGGIRYTTSGGDAGQTKSARDTILYAIVGLVISIMAFAMVKFVLSQL